MTSTGNGQPASAGKAGDTGQPANTGQDNTGQDDTGQDPRDDHEEPHDESLPGRLNWLRAGVLGANDGIISTAGLVVGVAGATASHHAIFVAGVAGLVAGSLSMAAGEYVSVSSQRDSERAMLDLEREELRADPQAELDELIDIYVSKGLERPLARQVAEQLTEHDALAAHADAELRLDPDALTNPWSAAGASFVSFAVGSLLPLLTMSLVPASVRVVATFVAVLLALMGTGCTSARMGQAPIRASLLRHVGGGFAAMMVTYAVGRAFGAL